MDAIVATAAIVAAVWLVSFLRTLWALLHDPHGPTD